MNKQINHQTNTRQLWLISRLFFRNVALLGLTTILINPVAASYAQSSLIQNLNADSYIIAQTSADDYNNRGIDKVKKGDYQEAIQYFTQALRLAPNDANIYNNRGFIRVYLGENQEAIEDFTQALRLNPRDFNAYNNRGIARRQQKNYQGAIEDFTQALHLKPEFTPLYFNRGNIRLESGDYQGAIEDYQKAAALSQQQENTELWEEALNKILIAVQQLTLDSSPTPTQAKELKQTPTKLPPPISTSTKTENKSEPKFQFQDLLEQQLGWWEKKYPGQELNFIVLRLGIIENTQNALKYAANFSDQWKRPVIVLPTYPGLQSVNAVLNYSLPSIVPDNGVAVLDTILKHGHKIEELHFWSGGNVAFNAEYKEYLQFIQEHPELGLEKIVGFGGRITEPTRRAFREESAIEIVNPLGCYVYLITTPPLELSEVYSFPPFPVFSYLITEYIGISSVLVIGGSMLPHNLEFYENGYGQLYNLAWSGEKVMETPPQLARILATSSNTAPEENGNSQVVSRSDISPDDDSKPVHYIDANGNILVDIRDADPRGVLSSSNLNPQVKAMIVEVVYRLQAEGYRPYIVESFRTLERQNQIPSENTGAAAGRSWHNYGLAVDIAFWNDQNTGPSWAESLPWGRLGALGKEAGFTQWGGDWTKRDRVHLEYHPQNPRPSLAPENWINLYLKDPDHPDLVSAWASVGIPTTPGEVWLAVSMRQEITENSSERQDFEEGLAQSRLKALEDHNPDGLPPPPPPGAATLPRNISEAIKRGEIAVEAEGTGNPSSLRLRITNKNPDRWMQIGIPPGTTFNPGTLNTQRMTISPSR